MQSTATTKSISASTRVLAHDARTALINGICHRALRCISRFTLAPPGLCFALCFAPSVRPVPGMRRGCIRSRSSEAVVRFYPPFPPFLSSLANHASRLADALSPISLRYFSRTEIFLRRAGEL